MWFDILTGTGTTCKIGSLSAGLLLWRQELASIEEGLPAKLLALPLEVPLELGGLPGNVESFPVALLHIQHHVQHLQKNLSLSALEHDVQTPI